LIFARNQKVGNAGFIAQCRAGWQSSALTDYSLVGGYNMLSGIDYGKEKD